MPPELRKAHQENDKAVMEAYEIDWKNMTEAECVSKLMELYQELSSKTSVFYIISLQYYATVLHYFKIFLQLTSHVAVVKNISNVVVNNSQTTIK